MHLIKVCVFLTLYVMHVSAVMWVNNAGMLE